MAPLFIYTEGKKNAQSNLDKTNLHRKNYYMHIGLLKHGFRIKNSWKWKKILEVVAWASTYGLVPLNDSCLTRCKIQGLIRITCFCCFTMWTCRPGFIWGPCMNNGAPTHFILVDREFLKNLNGNNWLSWWTCSMLWWFAWFKSFRFLSLGISTVYYFSYRSQWYRDLATTNAVDFVWFLQHLHFSFESGDHCSDMQRYALNLKISAASSPSEGLTLEIMLQPFLLYLVHLFVFRHVCKTAKSDLASLCLSVCLCVRPSTWNNSAPTGRIFIIFDGAFFEKLSKKLEFH
jgi:hypothetical protein